MFKHTKTIILSLCLILTLTACSPKPSGQEASPSHPSYSNLNSPSSLEEVRSLLSAHLDKDSVEEFLKLVKDYNDIVGPSMRSWKKGYASDGVKACDGPMMICPTCRSLHLARASLPSLSGI